MYGGVNREGNYPSQLWRLNLDSLEWVKCEQKGEAPTPTEGGQLIAFEKNWLLHYEGFNSRSSQNSYFIYIYSADSKSWYRCEGGYEHSLRFRLGTALCLQNGRIFMFGGACQTEDGFEYLSDMYELKANPPIKQNKNLDVRVINKRTPVPARTEHTLLPLGRDYLCLMGGRNAE
jgi:hypothetical protein